MSYDPEEKMVRESRGGYGPALMGFEQTGVFGQGKASLPSISITSLLQWIKPTIGMTIGGHSGGGTGPYKCTEFRSHPGLPKHTIYQPDPTTLPPDLKLPVLLWGNGACIGWGGWFSKFLAEIASHGYFVIANGIPEFSGVFTKTKWTDMIDAMNWVDGNAGTGAYAHVDATRIAVAGQSCGGLQAFTASLDPRVTLTCIFNSGLINEENTGLFEKLHAPVGFFLGGPSDIAFVNGERDYRNMPAKIPSVKLNLPVGHMGTYGSANGGQFGRAAVAFLEWQMKGDKTSAKLFLDQESPLTRDGWDIVSKGYDESRQVKQPAPRKPIINLLPITDVRSIIEERKSKKNISGKPDRTVKL